jgi:predicted unusual protein kinase regulating ubiquinone biosynthesis (AarF/ABC1/UbiB family)
MTNRFTGLHRAWELSRRVARDVMVVVRHVALYLVSRLRGRRSTAARHTRVAIEELGPTAIKLGQMLSTRNDVLPPDWQHELTRLQDAAPPVPPAAVRATIVEELGRPLQDLFESFVDAPLACASIGQAHTAELPGGIEVVVKVRRPGVVDEVDLDLDVITSIVALMSRASRRVRSLDPIDLVDQFSTTLRHELDYSRESNSVERFAANFAGDPDIRIPAVHHELSTARVLTLERLGGYKIDDLDALEAAGIDRVALAQRATSLVLRTVFEYGFFHADPHPGNFFIEPTGRIGLIDFGMVGEVGRGNARRADQRARRARDERRGTTRGREPSPRHQPRNDRHRCVRRRSQQTDGQRTFKTAWRTQARPRACFGPRCRATTSSPLPVKSRPARQDARDVRRARGAPRPAVPNDRSDRAVRRPAARVATA